MAYDRLHPIETVQVEALKAGMPSAWKDLLALHCPRLLGYVIRMVGDQATAEEIVQDSMVNIYHTIDRFDGRCSIKSWLYRAVHNCAIDEIRRRKRYVDVDQKGLEDYFDDAGRWKHDCPGWDGFATKQLDEKRLLILVREQLDLLPHTHREVLLLKEVEGLSTLEICAVLDIIPGNLCLRIHRARAALRAAVVGG
ncbi:hypothetical protein COB64_01080 [Candidatus Wolfebacteria bacterium]|nr:MAG: hypothetical protein COB64_01080 [Candidatus Wolfebacteria bacterium]